MNHQTPNPPDPLNPEPRTLNPNASRPGRPRFLDDIKRGQLIAIVANGCGVAAAARYLGCHPRTIRRECCNDPSFRQQLKRAQFQGQLEPIQNLRKAAKTHWRAAAWMLERSRPYAFTPTKADLFNNEDVNDLIDGINDAVLKALPDRQLADQVIDSIENYVAKKTDDLLHEDPKEKRRRTANRRYQEAIARKRRDPDPEPPQLCAGLPIPHDSEILDGFPLEDDEQDTSQYTSDEELAADAHELEPAPVDSALTPPHSAFCTLPSAFPADLPPSGSTVTIHPLPISTPSQTPTSGSETTDNAPTAASNSAFFTEHFALSSLPTAELPTHLLIHSPTHAPRTKLTKPLDFCHSTNRPHSPQPLDTSTLRHFDPPPARTKPANFASRCGTPETNDKTDRTVGDCPDFSMPGEKNGTVPFSETVLKQIEKYTRLPAASASCSTHPHTHHPNQPYSPVTTHTQPHQSSTQTQTIHSRQKVRRFTKRALARRLSELEIQVHKMNMAVMHVIALLDQLAASDQPARPIGFCPGGTTPQPADPAGCKPHAL